MRGVRAFEFTAKLQLVGREAVRVLRMPADFSFEDLHLLLQAAFGWDNDHLYGFSINTKIRESTRFGPRTKYINISYDPFGRKINDTKLPLSKKLTLCIPNYRKFTYTYDYGDSWKHKITLSRIIENCVDRLPMLVSGHGDAPPEDIGGMGGFENFLEIRNNPLNDRYRPGPDGERRCGPDEPEFDGQWALDWDWEPFDFDKAADRVSRYLR